MNNPFIRLLQSAPEPITRAFGFLSKNKNILWENKKRTINNLRKYRACYENGGYVSEAIDLYPLYILSNGYTLQAAEGKEGLKDKVQEFLDKYRLNQTLWMLIVDSLIVMDGIAEIVYGKGSLSKVPIDVVVRPAECFEIKTDEYGRPVLYIQKYDIDGNSLKSPPQLEPANVIDLKLIPRSDSIYGISLLRRAEDDINRDTESITGIANGIRIHGTPKYETRINSNNPDAPPLSDEEYNAIKTQYEDINAKDSFVVEGDIQTSMLDVSGVQNVDMYSQVTMERVASALGVPEELLGMRKGSTDATAVSRIGAFFKKIQTFQSILADVINVDLIDRITGIPGTVWIEFNDPDPSDNLKEAEFVLNVAKINPMDPFSVMSDKQMRAYLGVDEEQYQNDNGEIDENNL